MKTAGRRAGDYWNRGQCAGTGTGASDSGSDDDWLSLFGFCVFQARERKYVASRNRADLVEKLHRDTKAAGRKLVVYISMAFGNPYDEPWGAEIVEDALVWLKDVGVKTVSLADTVGTASPDEVAALYKAVKGLRGGRRDRRAFA